MGQTPRSEHENVKFLWDILTADGIPTLDMVAMAQELDLVKATVQRRWRDLKAAMEQGTNPGPSAWKFVWLALLVTGRHKEIDWARLATKHAVSEAAVKRRYGRLDKPTFSCGSLTIPYNTKARLAAVDEEDREAAEALADMVMGL